MAKETQQRQKIDDNFMSTDYEVIVIFSYLWPIYINPEARFWTRGL